MVSDNTKRNISLFVGMIFNIRNLYYMLHYVLNSINLKKIVNTLRNTGKSFKAHACVNVAAFKLCVVARAVIFKLGENKGPDFNKAVTVTARGAVRLAAAVLLAAVIINL